MGASKRSKYFIAAVFTGYLAFCAGIFLFFEIQHFVRTPADPLAEIQTFNVSPGETFRGIAERLQRENIVESAFKLRLYARVKGLDVRIQAGEYALSAAQPPAALLEAMASGRVRLHRVTVPEGYTLFQIAALMDQAGLAEREAFIAAATDPETARRLGIDAPTLEGYLFPETYLFPKQASPETILSAMVAQFRKAFQPQWETDAAKAGFTLHQVVTLASMIEKETGAGFERPLIASVFHNRLKKNMRLESDPTVIYGIYRFDGNLTRQHLNEKTPYNTYRISGLPPGPIANPGADSLEAAVYPADTRFLYFVSKNDGTHVFSEDLPAHRSAVKKYQKEKGKSK
ncbi:MAG: endolytic transglycosylase MltG [Deltaproteobacteria bacterium]|nr:endolytic transglycosylase MltG [Deltaproteobacteria bacterium]MBW2041253.1 endolytic transglycosylase MltG [Deltaproteobacteria bacterium]MBW2132951.1 endolytic transglycosylase MltG [Deltaproteobacteria bacterium]